jgi:hypothetical protein
MSFLNQFKQTANNPVINNHVSQIVDTFDLSPDEVPLTKKKPRPTNYYLHCWDTNELITVAEGTSFRDAIRLANYLNSRRNSQSQLILWSVYSLKEPVQKIKQLLTKSTADIPKLNLTADTPLIIALTKLGHNFVKQPRTPSLRVPKRPLPQFKVITGGN